MATDFANRRVLVTGASSGLGRELALVLAQRGAILALAARDSERLNVTAKEIVNAHPKLPRPVVIPTDISVSSQVEGMIGRCERELGGLDTLINNAGAGVYGQSSLLSRCDLEELLRVNFLGAAWTTLRALPLLQRQSGGLIVNIASAAAIHGVPFLSVYSATKAALVAFSQSLRAELTAVASRETPTVKIALVYPGYLQTDFFANEKRVGTARRPQRPYLPADEAARQIVAQVERGKTDIYLTRESHVLRLAQRIAPTLVDRAMVQLARQLTQPEKSAL